MLKTSSTAGAGIRSQAEVGQDFYAGRDGSATAASGLGLINLLC